MFIGESYIEWETFKKMAYKIQKLKNLKAISLNLSETIMLKIPEDVEWTWFIDKT